MKTTRFIFLSLALPACLAAQQPAAPPTEPITTAFKGRISGLERNIAQAFDSIPESKFSYKPTPAQLTFGYIAQHVTDDNYLFCSAFGVAQPNRTPEETSTAADVKATWPKDKLVAQLKTSFAYCQDALNTLTDAKLPEQVQMNMGGRARTVTRAQMVLGHALDAADHYSQIANYMRLNGMTPPSALPRPGRGGN